MRTILTCTCLAALISCTQFPDLDNTVDKSVSKISYPNLVPLESLVDTAGTNAITPVVEANLNTRIARLKSRAARLRRTVIDAPTRQRMKNGIAL